MDQLDNSAPRRPGNAASLLRALAILLVMLAVLASFHYAVVWRLGMPG